MHDQSFVGKCVALVFGSFLLNLGNLLHCSPFACTNTPISPTTVQIFCISMEGKKVNLLLHPNRERSLLDTKQSI
jgi:hypothetical protein